jgi:hypothetical protein
MRHAIRDTAAFDGEGETAVSLEYESRRVEGCVCGGLLAADPVNWRAVYMAVTRHQRTSQHEAWRDAIEAWRDA